MLLQTAAIPAAGLAEVPTRVSTPSEDNPNRHHCVLGHFGRKMGNTWCLLPGAGMQSQEASGRPASPQAREEAHSWHFGCFPTLPRTLWLASGLPPFPPLPTKYLEALQHQRGGRNSHRNYLRA